jgi:hypothetical protein
MGSTSGTVFIAETKSRNEFALTKSTPLSTKACTGFGAPALTLASTSRTLRPVRSGFCSWPDSANSLAMMRALSTNQV